MREHLSVNSLLAQILMHRQHDQNLILVVEGPDDYDLIDHHNSDRMTVIPGVGGRPMVLEAADLAERERIGGVRFIVDSDFDRVLNPGMHYSTLVITSESHDLIMDAVHSARGALHRVIKGMTRKVSRSRSNPVEPSSLVEQATEIATLVTRLRLANERHKLGLNLRGFPFGQLKSKPITMTQVVNVAVQRSREAKTDCVLRALEEIPEAHHSRELMGDHDFFSALANILRSIGVNVKDEQLVSSFMSAVPCISLSKSAWYGSVVDWAIENGIQAFNCNDCDLAA